MFRFLPENPPEKRAVPFFILHFLFSLFFRVVSSKNTNHSMVYSKQQKAYTTSTQHLLPSVQSVDGRCSSSAHRSIQAPRYSWQVRLLAGFTETESKNKTINNTITTQKPIFATAIVRELKPPIAYLRSSNQRPGGYFPDTVHCWLAAACTRSSARTSHPALRTVAPFCTALPLDKLWK